VIQQTLAGASGGSNDASAAPRKPSAPELRQEYQALSATLASFLDHHFPVEVAASGKRKRDDSSALDAPSLKELLQVCFSFQTLPLTCGPGPAQPGCELTGQSVRKHGGPSTGARAAAASGARCRFSPERRRPHSTGRLLALKHGALSAVAQMTSSTRSNAYLGAC
jgi:hypothetical protein